MILSKNIVKVATFFKNKEKFAKLRKNGLMMAK